MSTETKHTPTPKIYHNLVENNMTKTEEHLKKNTEREVIERAERSIQRNTLNDFTSVLIEKLYPLLGAKFGLRGHEVHAVLSDCVNEIKAKWLTEYESSNSALEAGAVRELVEAANELKRLAPFFRDTRKPKNTPRVYLESNKTYLNFIIKLDKLEGKV